MPLPSSRWAALPLAALAVASCKRPPVRTIELTSLARTDNEFVAIGIQDRGDKGAPARSGIALRSADGQTWSEVALSAPGSLVMVVAGGVGLVAVGSSNSGAPIEGPGAGGSAQAGSGGSAGSSGTAGAAGLGGAAGASAGGSAGTAGDGGAAGESGAAGEGGAAGDAGAAGASGGQAGDGGAAGASGGGAGGQGGAGTSGGSGQSSGGSGQGGAAGGSAGSAGSGGPGSVPMGVPGSVEGASAGGLVMVSRDGTQWEKASTPPGAALLDVASGGSGGLVAAARSGLYWSQDGRVWVRQPVGSEASERWSQVEASKERYVALGAQPAVSSDGRTWKVITSVPEGELRGLRFTGGFFYSTAKVGGFFGGVGSKGCVLLRSTDGESWKPVEGAAPSCAIDVGAGSGQALFLASEGVYEAGSFAGPWALRSELEGGLPLRIEQGGGRWVIAAEDGLWSSADGVSWLKTFKP